MAILLLARGLIRPGSGLSMLPANLNTLQLSFS
jgi:hypothetical protein